MEEKLACLDFGVLLVTILVVDVYHGGIVNLLRHHLREEVTQQAYKALDVLFAGEKNFLACDGWLPKLAKCISFFFV